MVQRLHLGSSVCERSTYPFSCICRKIFCKLRAVCAVHCTAVSPCSLFDQEIWGSRPPFRRLASPPLQPKYLTCLLIFLLGGFPCKQSAAKQSVRILSGLLQCNQRPLHSVGVLRVHAAVNSAPICCDAVDVNATLCCQILEVLVGKSCTRAM